MVDCKTCPRIIYFPQLFKVSSRVTNCENIIALLQLDVTNVTQTSHFTLKENWTEFSYSEPINRGSFYSTASKYGFLLYVTHLSIFSKRVHGEMSFQRGKMIMA